MNNFIIFVENLKKTAKPIRSEQAYKTRKSNTAAATPYSIMMLVTFIMAYFILREVPLLKPFMTPYLFMFYIPIPIFSYLYWRQV